MKITRRKLKSNLLPINYSLNFFLFLFLCSSSIYAKTESKSAFNENLAIQSETVEKDKVKVKGIVMDNEGYPLPGAAVVDMDTKIGVITDVNGKYSLEVSPTSKLKFSYIGMIEQFITVSNKQ